LEFEQVHQWRKLKFSQSGFRATNVIVQHDFSGTTLDLFKVQSDVGTIAECNKEVQM